MSNRPSNVVILGSTGSIGEQALQVIDQHPDKFKVVGLAARDEVDAITRQAEKYKPRAVALGDESCYRLLQEKLGGCDIVMGLAGMCEMAALDDVDTVLVAVSGAVGILPTIAAINRSRRIALANKETLVAAGEVVMDLARTQGAEIIPVDSEHSAIFQCLSGESKHLRNLWLTASGGPFRDYTREQLSQVTVDMALKHPNWKMGPKVTIDSATLMNKGLEVIEAHHLFAVDYDHIKVLVQKESVIHSMVELVDGSFLGHLGTADMRIPIQYALSYPDRFESPAAVLDFAEVGAIHFQKPDFIKFPLLQTAFQAGRQGGTLPAVMNAANEVAVGCFLNQQINFLEIAEMVAAVLDRHIMIPSPGLEEIFAADRWARDYCRQLIKKGECR
ncbi:MAG: 1-deoxy-D-xylulose-5-phosphate reductoisomerase [Syntrophomonadaceae bacterium]|nr:1-deoxy-D-xylulose-5-phosphate reductoisomerase [Syntrophomonadaceae bacterium]